MTRSSAHFGFLMLSILDGEAHTRLQICGGAERQFTHIRYIHRSHSAMYIWHFITPVEKKRNEIWKHGTVEQIKTSFDVWNFRLCDISSNEPCRMTEDCAMTWTFFVSGFQYTREKKTYYMCIRRIIIYRVALSIHGHHESIGQFHNKITGDW